MAAKSVSAAEVRAFFKANPDKTPAEGVKSLNGRGRLHPSLIEAFAKAKRSKARYEVGAKPVKTVKVKGKNVPVSELRPYAEGKRGRIGAAAVEAYLASQK